MYSLGSRTEIMKEDKAIRIWNGCKVVTVLVVAEIGVSSLGGVSGAQNSTKIDIELDPWAGLIVDHTRPNSPVNFRDSVFREDAS